MVLLSAAGHAQAPTNDPRTVQPERPTVATHAHTVAPWYVEFEAGVQGDRYARGARAYNAPIVTKIGLASHVQLNIGTPVVFAADPIGQATGLGDVNVGLKWRLMDDAPLLGDFAVIPSIKLANGSSERGTGSGTTDVAITVISSHSFGPVAMDVNGILTRVGASSTSASGKSALWTFSFGFPVAGRLSWVAEVFGQPTIDGSGAASTAALLTGPTLLLDRAFNVDVGLITPFHGDMPNAIYAGLVWNAGRLPFGRR